MKGNFKEKRRLNRQSTLEKDYR